MPSRRRPPGSWPPALRRAVRPTALPIAAAALAALAALVVYGQAGAPRRAPAAAAEPARQQPWTIAFDELTHSDATGEGHARGVVATSDEGAVIRSDLFQWNDRQRRARATGHLRMTDPQVDATAESAEIDYARGRRLIVLTGDVRMALKPKPADSAPGAAAEAPTTPPESDADESIRDARRQPIEVTCERVEYQYARGVRHAVLSGSFQAVQKLPDTTRTLTAAKAEWFGNEDRVLLRGPVHFEDTHGRKGDTAEDVVIGTREGAEALQLKRGTYTLPIEEDEEPPAGGSPAESPPPRKPAQPPAPARGQPGAPRPAQGSP